MSELKKVDWEYSEVFRIGDSVTIDKSKRVFLIVAYHHDRYYGVDILRATMKELKGSVILPQLWTGCFKDMQKINIGYQLFLFD